VGIELDCLRERRGGNRASKAETPVRRPCSVVSPSVPPLGPSTAVDKTSRRGRRSLGGDSGERGRRLELEDDGQTDGGGRRDHMGRSDYSTCGPVEFIVAHGDWACSTALPTTLLFALASPHVPGRPQSHAHGDRACSAGPQKLFRNFGIGKSPFYVTELWAEFVLPP
jgi:hypothetical protein